MRHRFVLPLPRFVLRPLTAAVIAAVHLYLAVGHLWQLIVGDVVDTLLEAFRRPCRYLCVRGSGVAGACQRRRSAVPGL